jgi:hypothetical protein
MRSRRGVALICQVVALVVPFAMMVAKLSVAVPQHPRRRLLSSLFPYEAYNPPHIITKNTHGKIVKFHTNEVLADCDVLILQQ